MEKTELIENFKNQQTQVLEDIKRLDVELTQKKELYLKLQGALEGLELLEKPEEEKSEPSTEESA